MNKEVEKLGQKKKAKYEKEEILRFRAGEESLPPPKITRNWSDEERLIFFLCQIIVTVAKTFMIFQTRYGKTL